MSDTLRLVLVSIHVRRDDQAVPLGAACVASAVKADPDLGSRCSVVLVDSFPEEGARELADRVAGLAPDLVGFSLYLWNRDTALGAARRLRALLPDAVLFSGGPDATARLAGLVADPAAETSGPFDFVVAGEGEGATVAALRALLAGEDFSAIPGVFAPAAATDPAPPCRAPIEDPASLPSPWLDGTLVPRSGGGTLWELARGCPYACAYCYESKGERRLRRIPAARLSAELDLFVREKVASVFVLDPTFNADKERARSLLDRIAAVAPDIHFHFEARAESLDRGLAKRFAAVGASLQIGLQTARPEIAEQVGRTLDRGLFASRIGLLNEEGAVFGLDLIYGLPGDDLAGYRGSLDFALSLFPNNLDLFRLAVLPGTTLADGAAALGLDWDREAPYLVRSTPTFPAADLAAAERLSTAADLFYNRGRAVAWFNQVLHPLSEKPSFFLEGFAAFAERAGPPDSADPVGIERLQLDYLTARFAGAELDYLLPAVWDVVRFNGAWSRALAEGIETAIEFNYDPDAVLSPDAQDLEEFAALAERSPTRARVVCGEDGPELIVL
jgi:hypothetical protein